MNNISRRTMLKGGALVGGASFMSFSQLFGYSRLFAQSDGDDPQTILNLAATAETLACTHYYNVLTDSNIALVSDERAILRSALDTELQHLEYLNANGAQALASEFYFPVNVYTDREQFSTITEMAEMAFVAAYLAATRRIAELGNFLLAATTTQVAVTEQVHLALIRQIGGRVPNHVSLGQALFYNTSGAGPVLQGFLEGGDGFVETASPFPGAEAIRTEVGGDGVESIRPFTDATLFPEGGMVMMMDNMSCTVTAGGQNVNIRSGAGTNFSIQNVLLAGTSASVDGTTAGQDGFSWYRLGAGGFVRSDVVTATDTCSALPAV